MKVENIRSGDQLRRDDGRVLWTASGHARPDPELPGFVYVPVRLGTNGAKDWRRWMEGESLPIDRPVTPPAD